MLPLKCGEQRADQSLEVHLPFPGRSYNHRPQLALERRGRLRASSQLQARVWGVDRYDEVFSVDCKVAVKTSNYSFL
jgi:hypothetical protein